jgi:hypothetical protein
MLTGRARRGVGAWRPSEEGIGDRDASHTQRLLDGASAPRLRGSSATGTTGSSWCAWECAAARRLRSTLV